MENLKCTSTLVLFKSPIECPECKQDYAIYEIQHECNVLASCDAPKRSYCEKYIPLVDAPRKPVVICENCKKNKQAKPLRQRKCPGCQFYGYYVCGADRFCPSCVASREASVTVVPVPKKSAIIVESSIIAIIKTPAKVFFQIDHVGVVPSDDNVKNAQVMVLTDQSATTPEFFSAVITMTPHDDPVRKFIRDVQKMLGEQRLAHDLYWQNTGTLAWEWFKFLFNKHADTMGPML